MKNIRVLQIFMQMMMLAIAEYFLIENAYQGIVIVMVTILNVVLLVQFFEGQLALQDKEDQKNKQSSIKFTSKKTKSIIKEPKSNIECYPHEPGKPF